MYNRPMRRKGFFLLILLALCVSPVSVFSDLKKDFDGIVDFSLTMDNIQKRLDAQGGPAGLTDKLLVLTGAVASVQFLGGEGEGFVAALELVEGEWIGVQDVHMYKAYLIVYGADFEARLPEKRSRDGVENEIMVNSQILAIGRIVDVDTSESGLIPIIECYYIREL